MQQFASVCPVCHGARTIVDSAYAYRVCNLCDGTGNVVIGGHRREVKWVLPLILLLFLASVAALVWQVNP